MASSPPASAPVLPAARDLGPGFGGFYRPGAAYTRLSHGEDKEIGYRLILIGPVLPIGTFFAIFQSQSVTYRISHEVSRPRSEP